MMEEPEPESRFLFLYLLSSLGKKVLYWTGSRWQRVDVCWYDRKRGRPLGPKDQVAVLPLLSGPDCDPIMVPLSRLKAV